ncbi:MAG TPA: four helix bundle protein [Saprospiraceae bacterium]|nr:four helix bundle protein [Saprospiraceae bacterium]HRO08748.1 four helix bundle protein [Saprospiraceae bacterium]HRP41613.1 four helix bundle protein [Saprospiraceae bacterium]
MKENIVKIKTFDFALRIVRLYQFLCDTKKEFILSKQLLRSGTSIGANVRESEHSQSKADFINKLSISLKEANETDYWIDLLFKADYIDQKQYDSLKFDIDEILKLLVSIIKSSKKNN